MILNFGKRHYMHLGGHSQIDYISLNGIEIESSRNKTEVLLDNDLKLDAHIQSQCRKAAQKLSALSRINKHLSCDQMHLLVNSAVKSKFSYLSYSRKQKKCVIF